MFTDEYKPTQRNHYIDSTKHYQSLKLWITSTINGVKMKNKFALLSGYSGTGKTSLVKLLANELGLDLIVKNSSESMLKADVAELTKLVVTSSVTGKRMLLLDEVDGVRKQSQTMIAKICKKSRIPIILVCNDKYQLSPALRFGGYSLDFKRPTKTQIRNLLQSVITRAKLTVTPEVIGQIVENTTDYRSALNTLEMAHGAASCDISDLFSNEDNELNPFELCQRILGGEKPDIGMNPHLLNFWLFESTVDTEFCAAIDRNLGRESETGYRSWFYAYRLFDYLRPAGMKWGKINIKFPARFKKRAVPKKPKPKKAKKKPKVEKPVVNIPKTVTRALF